MSEQKLQARVYSRTAPTEEQLAQLRDFLHQKYQRPVNLHWERDDRMKDGFRLELGEGESRELVYDWSSSGKSRQLKDKIAAAIRSRSDVIPLLRKTLEDFQPEASATEIGTVLSYGDGIAEVSGLPGAEYGEILIFENGVRGMVLDLKEKSIGCVVFAGEAAVQAGSVVLRSGRSAGIPVGDAFLGRVIDPLGAPIDGKGKISESDYYPIEAPAPGIIDRQPVDKPMQTGLLAIDSMFPIGRGQRELIIGDRQTGKTAIALDTILNQKDQNVVCIYVAIGQKASSVAQLVQALQAHDALRYTIVLCAAASDSAPLQYIAPYAGCAMGEYFMHQGELRLLSQIDAVEFNALVGLDEKIADAAERACLNEIRPVRIDGNGHVWRFDDTLFHVDQIPGIEHCTAAEGFVKLRAELHPLIFRHTAAFQHILQFVAADDQRVVAFCLLPRVNAVLEFLPHLLHDGERALVVQRIAQNTAEGVALLIGGHRWLDAEQCVDQGLIVRAG